MKTLIKKAIYAFGYELQPEFTIDGMQQLAERVAGMTLQVDAPVAFDDSLDTEIGPPRLIRELRDEGEFETAQVVGKVTVLRRTPQYAKRLQPTKVTSQ